MFIALGNSVDSRWPDRVAMSIVTAAHNSIPKSPTGISPLFAVAGRTNFTPWPKTDVGSEEEHADSKSPTRLMDMSIAREKIIQLEASRI